MVNNGEIIPANKELLKVTNLSTVWVIGQIYEKDLGKLRVGSGASVTTDAYPGQVFRGNITYIDPNLDQNTRTAQVRIELPNPDQKFKIGMYVNIALATVGGSENTVPTVPKEAVQNINNQTNSFCRYRQSEYFYPAFRQNRRGNRRTLSRFGRSDGRRKSCHGRKFSASRRMAKNAFGRLSLIMREVLATNKHEKARKVKEPNFMMNKNLRDL